MNEVRWLKIRSWHIWNLKSRGPFPGESQTLCGRWTVRNLILDRPADEKTCESCLRIQVGR